MAKKCKICFFFIIEIYFMFLYVLLVAYFPAVVENFSKIAFMNIIQDFCFKEGGRIVGLHR